MENKDIVLYGNIILFLILSLVSVNELKSVPNDNDPYRNQTKETIKTATLFLATLIVLFFTVGQISVPTKMESWKTYYFGGIALLALVYGYTVMSYNRVFNYLMQFVLVFIVIVGLAIVFQVFANYFKSFRGIGSFITYLLFYIPCLLLNFVKYLLNEFRMTTNPVLVLFVFELLLVLSYLYLPGIIQNISLKDGTAIQKSYVYLNGENVYPMNETMYKDNKELQIMNNQDETIRRNYAISMWIFVNDYSKNMAGYNKETVIFNYGDGKPKITYKNKETNTIEHDKMDTCRIYFTNNTENDTDQLPYYDLKLPSQKWNHIVFNYTSKHVDLFVNGKLERTYYFKKNIPTYMDSDAIITGSENGISGSICNIRYYKKNLSQRDVVNIYNPLMNKNPPVNNL